MVSSTAAMAASWSGTAAFASSGRQRRRCGLRPPRIGGGARPLRPGAGVKVRLPDAGRAGGRGPGRQQACGGGGTLSTLIGEPWADYGLIDSGHGRKLERYGRFRFIRPEAQALWAPADADWRADGEFVGGTDDDGVGRRNPSPQVPRSWPLPREGVRFHAPNTPFCHLAFFPDLAPPGGGKSDRLGEGAERMCLFRYTGVGPLAREARVAGGRADGAFCGGSEDEGGGRWNLSPQVPQSWPLAWEDVRFHAANTPFRHLAFFPDRAPQWAWMRERIGEGAETLNLFGYTGVGTLAMAARGARVTHVDASKKAVEAAKANQAMSGMAVRPIRWQIGRAHV